MKYLILTILSILFITEGFSQNILKRDTVNVLIYNDDNSIKVGRIIEATGLDSIKYLESAQVLNNEGLYEAYEYVMIRYTILGTRKNKK